MIITMKPYDWSNITERREMLNEIDNLPSAEVPERKTGKWSEHKMLSRDYGKIYYQHDCCCELYESPYRFCPHCGAEMK